MRHPHLTRAALAVAFSLVASIGASPASADLIFEADQTVPANWHNTKATAQVIPVMNAGDAIVGTSNGSSTTTTGAGTLGAADYYSINLPAAAQTGVYVNRLTLNNADYPGVTFTGTIRGLTIGRTAGVNFLNPGTDALAQTSSMTTLPTSKRGLNQFYTFGKATGLTYRVAGNSTATAATPYGATLTTEQLTVQDLGTFNQGTFRMYDPTDGNFINQNVPDPLTGLTYKNRLPGANWLNFSYGGPVGTPDATRSPNSLWANRQLTKAFLYDENFNLVAQAESGVNTPNIGFDITQNLGYGKYYLAMSAGNSALQNSSVPPNNQSVALQGAALDFANIVVSGYNPATNMILDYATRVNTAGQLVFPSMPAAPTGTEYPGIAFGYRLKLPDGNESVIRSTSVQGWGDVFFSTFTVVPEPSALGLLAGVLPVMSRRSRRR